MSVQKAIDWHRAGPMPCRRASTATATARRRKTACEQEHLNLILFNRTIGIDPGVIALTLRTELLDRDHSLSGEYRRIERRRSVTCQTGRASGCGRVVVEDD